MKNVFDKYHITFWIVWPVSPHRDEYRPGQEIRCCSDCEVSGNNKNTTDYITILFLVVYDMLYTNNLNFF